MNRRMQIRALIFTICMTLLFYCRLLNFLKLFNYFDNSKYQINPVIGNKIHNIASHSREIQMEHMNKAENELNQKDVKSINYAKELKLDTGSQMVLIFF